MGRVEKSILIKAPPKTVWEILAFDRLPEWSEGFGERIEYTSEVNTPKDKYRIGATAQGIPKKPEDNYCRFQIIDSLENKKMRCYAWEKPKYLGTLRTGIVAMVISMVGLALFADYVFVFVPLVFLAYGTGVSRPILTSKLANSVTKKETATILGVNNSLISLAQIVTPIAGGFIIQYLPSQTLPILSALFFSAILLFTKQS